MAGRLSEFMTKLRALCDELKIPIMADEVLTGGGRTGKIFAYEYYKGIEPDFVTFGKGLQVAGVAQVPTRRVRVIRARVSLNALGAVAAAVVLLLLGQGCFASTFPVGGASGLGTLAQLAEIVVPDTRWEICHGGCDVEHRAVLSWPISLYFHRANLGASNHYLLLNRPFIEPQLRLVKNAFRFAFGHRVGLWYRRKGSSYLDALGVFVEGGGVLSSIDGNGGFVGGGVGLGGLEQSWLLDTFSLVYRHSWTSMETRHDVTFDVVVAIDFFR